MLIRHEYRDVRYWSENLEVLWWCYLVADAKKQSDAANDESQNTRSFMPLSSSVNYDSWVDANRQTNRHTNKKKSNKKARSTYTRICINV